MFIKELEGYLIFNNADVYDDLCYDKIIILCTYKTAPTYKSFIQTSSLVSFGFQWHPYAGQETRACALFRGPPPASHHSALLNVHSQ